MNPGPQPRYPRVVPALPVSGPPGDFIYDSATDASYVANNAGAYQILDTGSGDIGGSTGATDNAILRADGVGGKTLQSSVVTIADTTGAIAGARSIALAGLSSGSVTIAVPAAAGSNTLTLPAGTTDLSATGGTGQAVKQASTGAALTVGTVAASELSGLGTGVGAALAVNTGSTGAFVLREQVPYDLACQIVGVPDASAVVLRFIAVRAFTLSSSGQRGTAATAATAQTDFIVAVNAVTKATLRFAASGTTITVVGGTAATIAAGDIITITSPASPDGTLANIGLTLTGVLI